MFLLIMIIDLSKSTFLRGFAFEEFANNLLRKQNNNSFIFRTMRFANLDTMTGYFNLDLSSIKNIDTLKKYYKCIDLIEFVVSRIDENKVKHVSAINVYEVKSKVSSRKRSYDISRECYERYKKLNGLGFNSKLISIHMFENWKFSFNVYDILNYRNFCFRKNSRNLFKHKK